MAQATDQIIENRKSPEKENFKVIVAPDETVKAMRKEILKNYKKAFEILKDK